MLWVHLVTQVTSCLWILASVHTEKRIQRYKLASFPSLGL